MDWKFNKGTGGYVVRTPPDVLVATASLLQAMHPDNVMQLDTVSEQAAEARLFVEGPDNTYLSLWISRGAPDATLALLASFSRKIEALNEGTRHA